MKIKFLILTLSCIFFTEITTAAPLDEGKNIFITRCIACHKIDKDFAGPALANVDKRHTIDWIIKFVHSSQTVIKNGDTSAVALFSTFNRTVMPDHPDLTDQDIKSVVEYIKVESIKVVNAKGGRFEKPNELQLTPKHKQSIGFIVSFIIVIVTLILVLLFAVHVKQLEKKMHG